MTSNARVPGPTALRTRAAEPAPGASASLRRASGDSESDDGVPRERSRIVDRGCYSPSACRCRLRRPAGAQVAAVAASPRAAWRVPSRPRAGRSPASPAGRRASPSLRVKPLPLSRSVLPELVPGVTVSITGPSTVGHLDLAAAHRLVERDRQVEPDIVAVAAEERVRLDLRSSPARRPRRPGRARPCP